MKRLITFAFAVALFASISAMFSAESRGVEVSDTEKIALTSQQCTYSQEYLKTTLKPRDLRARVDRLQAYRYIYQRLDIFVGRLERNGQSGATDLRPLLNELSEKIDNFKNTYETYDGTREYIATYNNCKNDPGQFLKSVSTAREARQKVHATVDDIELHLEQSIKNQVNVVYQELLLAEERTGDDNE